MLAIQVVLASLETVTPIVLVPLRYVATLAVGINVGGVVELSK